jgi:ribosomal protein L11 methyltransferase
MTRRPLIQVSIATSQEAEEAVGQLLERVLGQAPSSYTDEDTKATSATVYLEKLAVKPAALRQELRAGLRAIAGFGLDVRPARITIAKVRREDWAESWKRHFKPMAIGRALLIKPSWSRRQPKAGQAVLVLDPGLSFGTGQHATTSFCLRQLVDARTPGRVQSFLDIGTGSGILALAATKLGYRPVAAFDFDPESVRVARANARQNRVRVPFQQQDLTRVPMRCSVRYDVVCANLMYDLLQSQCRRILNRLQPKGLLVLAGILTTQFPTVRKVYETAGMVLVETTVEKEWQSGAFRRKRSTENG